MEAAIAALGSRSPRRCASDSNPRSIAACSSRSPMRVRRRATRCARPPREAPEPKRFVRRVWSPPTETRVVPPRRASPAASHWRQPLVVHEPLDREAVFASHPQHDHALARWWRGARAAREHAGVDGGRTPRAERAADGVDERVGTGRADRRQRTVVLLRGSRASVPDLQRTIAPDRMGLRVRHRRAAVPRARPRLVHLQPAGLRPAPRGALLRTRRLTVVFADRRDTYRPRLAHFDPKSPGHRP